MDIESEVTWIYIQSKKGFSLPNWDVNVTIEKLSGDLFTKDSKFPIFIIPNNIDSIDELKGFMVITSPTRRIWFNRNNIGKLIEVCHIKEDGKKIEIDENRLLEIRSEIMSIINHLNNNDYGLALTRSEIIRDKINKLI